RLAGTERATVRTLLPSTTRFRSEQGAADEIEKEAEDVRRAAVFGEDRAQQKMQIQSRPTEILARVHDRDHAERRDDAPDEDLERSEEHTSELQSPDHLVCRLLLE